MGNSVKNINSLQSLDIEIYRLRSRAKVLEKDMDELLDYLQDNYSSMMVKSFLPVIVQKTGIAGSLLQLVFQNQRLLNSLSKLAGQLFDRIAEGVEFITDKLDSKKEA